MTLNKPTKRFFTDGKRSTSAKDRNIISRSCTSWNGKANFMKFFFFFFLFFMVRLKQDRTVSDRCFNLCIITSETWKIHDHERKQFTTSTLLPFFFLPSFFCVKNCLKYTYSKILFKKSLFNISISDFKKLIFCCNNSFSVFP